ncbi:arylamine N-acetyltransferase [Alicyclobacillus sp. SO9]|uniref:arylamine N-acetyltransferase family protein n=1 Tax=Alicyclobacillus sp. SO9 TaxID=2665646 RepID=UPI0018E909F5|nr:arylamine N-acetyltransferase [Alicyclobacillus sp. SO9]QQE77238.1 arylamine N-acetyltransferase [Alicyclobacillus sp. SO9]
MDKVNMDWFESGTISECEERGCAMDHNEYLRRINITEGVSVDYESLCLIQSEHMYHVPFENLDIAAGVPIELEYESMYEKLIVKGRGGYCYELNGLLYWLLRTLGFSVSMLSASVMREDGKFGPEFDHMLLLVNLNGMDYVVDVGFGDSVRSPLPLSGEIVTDISGSYRIENDTNRRVLYFQKQTGTDWTSEYAFTLRPRRLDEFQVMNVYQQTSLDSHFTQNLICSVATLTGRLTISGNVLIETIGSDKTRSAIQSEAERVILLKRYFGIDETPFDEEEA